MMLKQLTAFTIALVLTTVAFADQHKKPNMVVVFVDDHAFEAISAYGTYLKNFAKTPATHGFTSERSHR